MTRASALCKLPVGVLRGDASGPALAFRGIPYAQPPVGPLRFAPPLPAEPWPDERDATRFAAAPPQRSDPVVASLGMLDGCAIDEDCLTLNVFTPSLEAASFAQRAAGERSPLGARPVMVWIPGGAFVGGTSGVRIYDGARLAARGDIVVVTVSYRVGALGFACFDAEPGEPAVANLGLQDQIAALRWVQQHAGAFGGDPARVTVFGESAGAGSILALAGMPAARGLFARAIVQSAAPRGVFTLDEARARTRIWREELGLAAAPRSALREVPVERLLDAQYAVISRTSPSNGFFYAPVVDGVTLTESPAHAFARGAARELPLLIGTTRDEMHLYFTGKPASDAGAVAMLAPQLGLPDAEAARAAQILVDGFRAARERRGEPVTPCDVYLAVQTELSLRHDSVRLAEARAAQASRSEPKASEADQDGRTWMYLFGWRSPARGGVCGACHALDLPFVFGNLDAAGMAAFAGEGPEAQALAEAMMDAWVAFARDRAPWPSYDAARRATFELARERELRSAPYDEERALLARFSRANLR
jgi:para-nitrobenzyl esterase